MLAANVESSIVIDSYDEHQEDGEKEIRKLNKVISYGIGTALWPLTDWM